MTLPNIPRGFDWEAAGREIGERLGAYCALVVIGVDPVATGRVAIGIARSQSDKRRVAVGDLFAESPPIQALVYTDDPHGLVDSFLYGVSLSRIAYEVPGAGQLFVMPSGTEPPDYDEILPNPRWHRLAAGFREVSALLLLAVPASAPHVEDLVSATDGAILVGEAVPAQLPASRVVGTVREPKARVIPPVEEKPAEPTVAWTRNRVALTVGLAMTLALAGIAAWLAYRPLSHSGKSIVQRRPDTMHTVSPVLAATPDSSAARDSTADSTGAASAPVTVVVPTITNPADSASGSPFAVQLMATNTQAGAILRLQKDRKDLPAATFAPAIIHGVKWFTVVSGAYVTRADADSLLAGLRRRRLLLGDESVVRLPFAFLIDSVPAAAVPDMVTSYADRGQPVYALRQSNGIAWLLVGAFESVEQSSLYLETLRASNIKPVLVYRKGRAF